MTRNFNRIRSSSLQGAAAKPGSCSLEYGLSKHSVPTRNTKELNEGSSP